MWMAGGRTTIFLTRPVSRRWFQLQTRLKLTRGNDGIRKLMLGVEAAGWTEKSRQQRFASAAAGAEEKRQQPPLKKTPLYDLHIEFGGRMVPFAGWSMPVQYENHSIVQSTVHTREGVTVFDVSHMMQAKVFGSDSIDFLESLVTADLEEMEADSGALSVFTNVNGGIEDDLIITKTSADHLYLVCNAACADKDREHLKRYEAIWKDKGRDVSVEMMDGHGLLAVQGPKMVEVLQPLVDVDLSSLYFMHSVTATIAKNIPNCRITRCGYTGEDGVEISVEADRAAELCRVLLSGKPKGLVRLGGLGARDALRTEAGLCLYGADMDANTTPVEAGLAFVVPKTRRTGYRGKFLGAARILAQFSKKSLVKSKRVGFLCETGRPPRGGGVVLSEADENGKRRLLGSTTSGCPSPNLKRNIAMGYVRSKFAKAGTRVDIDVTGAGDTSRLVAAHVAKMPFVPAHYYTPPDT